MESVRVNSLRRFYFLYLWAVFIFYIFFEAVFNKTIIPLVLVGCEMIIVNEARNIYSGEISFWHDLQTSHVLSSQGTSTQLQRYP